MSEPLDPVTAGLASVLKSLRTRAGLTEERLAGTEIALDTLTGLGRVGEFMVPGGTSAQAIIEAVKAAAGSLEPTYSIVADVSLGLRLDRDPPDADLYATDLGHRRAALVKSWDRMHELRSAVPTVAAPTLRTLRLEIETAAFNALASALTDADSLRSSPAPPDLATAPGAGVHDHAEPGGAGEGDPDRAGGSTAPPPLVRSQAPLLLDEFDRIAAALRESLVRDTGHSGWPHDLRKGSKPVTALSTSYGIKSMLLLEGSLAPDLIPVAEYLRQAGEDGEYMAWAQVEPRPEVTAAVLETLHRINGTAKFDGQITKLKTKLGGFEKTRPFILTCLLEASVQLGDDGLTRSLVKDLLAARRPYGPLLLWPEKVEEDLVDPVASVAHTARAVCALAQATRPAARSIESSEGSGGSGVEVADAIDQAAVWLAGQQDLTNVSEIIDRQLTDPGRVEQVYVRHFTAAWVVKALVSAGLPASHPSVSAAVTRVWNDYSSDAALWSWRNGDLPVWMTFDAIDALRLASLAATIRSGGSGTS
jgi:hypothetical protein